MPIQRMIQTGVPQVQFVPIEGGLRNGNIISQEAINLLIECVQANLQTYTLPPNSAQLQHLQRPLVFNRLPCLWYTPKLGRPSAVTND